MLIFRGIRFIVSAIRIINAKLHNKNLNINMFKNRIEKGFNINIEGSGKIEIINKMYGRRFGSLEAINGNIIIEENIFLNERVKIVSMEKIIIEKNCIFGPGVLIYDHNHEFKDKSKLIIEQGFCTGKILIEQDVWVGANAVITKGVKIGKHSVIGANSVVTKDVPPYTVVAGNPAKIIKYL